MSGNYGAVCVLAAPHFGFDDLVAAVRRHWRSRGDETDGDPFDAPTAGLRVGRLTIAVLPENEQGYYRIIDDNLSSGDRDLARALAGALQTATYWLEVGEKRRYARLVGFGEEHRPAQREAICADHDFGEVLRLSHMEFGSPGDLAIRDLRDDPRVRRGEIALLAFERILRDESAYYKGASKSAIEAYEAAVATAEAVLEAAEAGDVKTVGRLLDEWAETPGNDEADMSGIGQAVPPLAILARALSTAEGGDERLVALDEASPQRRRLPDWYLAVARARARLGQLSDSFIESATTSRQVDALQRAAYERKGESASQALLGAVLSAPGSEDDQVLWAASGLEAAQWRGPRGETWLARVEGLRAHPAEASVPSAVAAAAQARSEQSAAAIARGLQLGVPWQEYANEPALAEVLSHPDVVAAWDEVERGVQRRRELRTSLPREAASYGPVFDRRETMPAPFVGARAGSRRIDWLVFSREELTAREVTALEAETRQVGEVRWVQPRPDMACVASGRSIPKNAQAQLHRIIAAGLGSKLLLAVNLGTARSHLTAWGKASAAGFGSALAALARLLAEAEDQTDPVLYFHTGANSRGTYWRAGWRKRAPYRERALPEPPELPPLGALATVAVCQRLAKSSLRKLAEPQRDNLARLVVTAMGSCASIDQELYELHRALLGQAPAPTDVPRLHRRRLFEEEAASR
jgi:hypothetical protein